MSPSLHFLCLFSTYHGSYIRASSLAAIASSTSSIGSSIGSPTESPMKNSIEAWRSPHLVDCKEMEAALTNEPETGVFKQTLTEPSFLMNIHNPSNDGVSKIIFDEGCWECSHLKEMLKALSKYDDSYFLDIGGNIGMWSLTAAAANHQTFDIYH